MDNRPLMLQVKCTEKAWSDYMRKIALEAGIPEAYRKIIVHVGRNPGISQKNLANACNVTGAAISRTINDMLREGYIRREDSETDRREKYLFLTEKGEGCMRRMKEKLNASDACIVRLLGEEKEQEIRDALALIENALTGGLIKDA